MKRKIILAIFTLALVAGLASWMAFRTAPLPRMRLADGGELRVLKVVYRTEEDHYLYGAPKVVFQIWRALPQWLQRVVPYPPRGISASYPVKEPGISVWYAWFDLKTGKPTLGPAGEVLMTLDDGTRLKLEYPDPADEYRRIMINDPPRDSQWLRFSVPVNWVGQPAEFTVRNPAWGR